MWIALLLTVIVIVVIILYKFRKGTLPGSDTLKSDRIPYQKIIDKNTPLEFDIAGIYYRSSETHNIARRLNPGTFLSYELEPDNEYDEYAVKIMHGNIHLGYVPAYYSEIVFTQLDNGGRCSIQIERNDRGDIPHVWVKLYPI